ncbi:hybrid sensor histidine kinase/response regulator [Sinomicrobium pectinilyticum]|uniref:histidine kinase n=1 Tax=Sinomicrobium pectinilyticum TaxID=1084421 RepID=A0A3N0EGQ5_SINP1|nr:hybrid sensor histidine kinase/response regulator transcription factor [Sinomicrobium pectinilyticum]RNL87055.1 hybrid sensor histidine kinase/response regulator [Sinomicrobium pectinilyticum]
MKQLHIFFILICIVNSLYGQDYYFRNYQVENGLSHNSITSSLQDHKGFMWFGTKDGLNRFDGYDFKVFQHNPNDRTSLGNNFISVLHEYENNIWIGTNDGLYLYSQEKEDFRLIDGTSGMAIYDIVHDDNGNIWYIASGKLYRMDAATQLHKGVYDFVDCGNIIKAPDGSIWMSNPRQLFRYIPSNDSFEKADIRDAVTEDPGFHILRLYAPDTSSVLIGTVRHGAFRYDLESGTISNYFEDMQKPLFVRDILNSDTEIWFATESGIYIYDKQNGGFTNFQKNYSDLYSLSDNAVYCFTRDREGGIWAGTYFGGINYRPREFSPFKKYFPKKGENSISGNAIREIHQDKNGILWIGTEDAGINKLDLSTGVFESFLDKNPDGKPFNIHGVLPVGNEIWAGTFQNGIQVLDIRNGDVLRQYREGTLISDFVLDIYRAKNGDIFILTSEGIQTYDPEKDKFETSDHFPSGIHYTCIIEDSDGTLWAGSIMQGVFFYNPGTNERGVLKHAKDNPSSISSNFINGIFRDSDNNIWITTENGLNLLNREDNSVKRYMKSDGLPGNIVYTVLEDKEHRLWISTSNGLAEFNRKKNRFKVYTKNNGLLNDQFNYASGLVSGDGTLYFGSVFGMVSFRPDEFRENTFRAPVLFTDLKINNETVKINDVGSPLKKSVTFSEDIRLTHDQKTFSLNFANLSFTAPKTTEYFYKMEGLDQDWYALGKNHAITFTQLPAGDYTLKIRSQNSDGLQGKTISLHIKILPPPWFSWWAYLIYILVILLVTLWIVRQYHRYSKSISARELAIMKSRKEKEVFQSKIDFFTNVAHEIRTPLSLIRAPLEKLSNTERLNEKASYYLDIMNKNTSRLLDLVNELLDFRKAETENLKLSFSYANISGIIRGIRQQFDTAIRDKDIQLIAREPQQDIYGFVDIKAFHKIINNLFNNAVKYSDNKIILTLSEEGENLEVRVKNDGRTIPEAHAERIFEPFFRMSEDGEQPGTGIGLSLAHSLAELHGGSLVYGKDEDGLNQFLLQLPVIRKHEETTVTEQQVQANTEEETGELLPSPSGTHLLIAEDNAELLSFIASEFRDDYRVHTAKNGETALQVIRNNDIQIVISDIMMPGLNGLELCKAVKTSVETSHIPVILLTAKGALNAKIEGLENGADAYITKPFSMEHLKVQVNTLLENRKHIMQAYSSKPLAYLKNVAPSKTESDFINRLDEVIIAHISDPDFSIETIADRLSMSRATLYRKIKAISDLTPNELINITRLKKAAELLATDNYKVFEVAYMVGYRSQSSFGRNFQKQFNMSPTEYVQQVKANGKQECPEHKKNTKPHTNENR